MLLHGPQQFHAFSPELFFHERPHLFRNVAFCMVCSRLSASLCIGLCALLVGHPKDGVAQPFLERRIVAELLEQFCVVGQEVDHDPLERGIVLDSGGFLVIVLHGILVGCVRCHLDRDLLGDDLADLVAVLPVDIAELVIECPDDVAQLIQLRFRLAATAAGRCQWPKFLTHFWPIKLTHFDKLNFHFLLNSITFTSHHKNM